jgi:Nucleotidyltransferase domain
VPLQIVDDYLAELARRMQEILGDDLVAVYAGGSYALGAYEHGRSDLDVAVVVEDPLTDDVKRQLVDGLRHEALPCPATGLELVIYARAIVERPTAAPGFELNLNTGARMDFRADFAPGAIEGFWFAIDRSILREHGLPVLGPPPGEVFAPIPRAVIAPVIEESMRWHGGDMSDDAALNTARSQHFLDTGHWISKLEARQRLDASQGAP